MSEKYHVSFMLNNNLLLRKRVMFKGMISVNVTDTESLAKGNKIKIRNINVSKFI